MIFTWAWKWRKKTAPKPAVDEVFTPGGEPSVTYVSRDQLRLETKVRSALRRKHVFIVVSGPTKCGKSVLCKRVLRDQPIITVHGGLVTSIEEFWKLISHQLRLPSSATTTKSNTWASTRLLEASASIIGWLQGKASATTAITTQRSQAANYTNVLSLAAIGELQRRDATLLIEDFHYIEPGIKRAIIRALKPSLIDGLRVVILSVSHRAFDAADVESEVEGRIEHVDIPSWSLDDLLEIAAKGFGALELEVPKNIQRRICDDSFGNPLLVQEICYELSETRLSRVPNSTFPIDEVELAAVYNGVTTRKGLNRFEQLTNAPLPEDAPVILLSDQTQVNLNDAVLGAVARIGPRPRSSLDDIRISLEVLTEGTVVDRDQVVAVLSAMTRAVAKGNAAPFEWESNRATLDITDPFLMFYLRWVLRDRRAIILQPNALDIATMMPPATEPLKDEDKSI
jgi:hypothetical protein